LHIHNLLGIFKLLAFIDFEKKRLPKLTYMRYSVLIIA
jgi:hypothetical protein